MATRELLILAPLEIEARAIRRAVEARDAKALPFSTRVVAIGIGCSRMPASLLGPATRAVILAGFAGALNPQLDLGDVLFEITPPRADLGVPGRAGRFITAPRIIATIAQKAELFQKTHADAVEMEHETILRHVSRYSVPLIHLRAISDRADEDLHGDIVRLVDAYGRPRLLRLGMAIVLKPGLISELMRLQRGAAAAAAALGEAVGGLMDALAQSECFQDAGAT